MPSPDDFSRKPELAVFAALDRLGVHHTTHHHAPTHTVEDGREMKAALPGGHSKNLFMKDKKGALVLVSAWAESRLELNQLHKQIGCQRLSFTGADLLWSALGVTPGSVSAFALLNDPARAVRFVIDAALLGFDTLYFHPLRNDMTTALPREGLVALHRHTGHEPSVVDFTRLQREDGSAHG
ncbi:prolyl-tRNA synthetase associated domain-containing protein [bacterium]|nr:prolyl-tRNA synthetase associated domain-containing protein [bacterium]